MKRIFAKAASLLLAAALCGSLLAAPAAYAGEPEPTPTPTPTVTPEGPDGEDGGQEPGIRPMEEFPDYIGDHH